MLVFDAIYGVQYTGEYYFLNTEQLRTCFSQQIYQEKCLNCNLYFVIN